MRVQAFRCSSNSTAASPIHASAQHASPAQQTPHCSQQPQLDSSNDWVARTAALTSTSQHPAANGAAQRALKATPSLSSSKIFTSPHAAQNGGGTDTQPASVGLQNGHASGPSTPDAGALVGSSAMADSHCGVVVALALCGDYVCSAGGDAMIKVWKADTLDFVRSVMCLNPCVHVFVQNTATTRLHRVIVTVDTVFTLSISAAQERAATTLHISQKLLARNKM